MTVTAHVLACTRGDATLDALRMHKPDVLILDVSLPPGGGLSVLRQMRREKLPTRVVLLADHHDGRHVLEAVRLGVVGILLPDMTPEALLQCVRAVHAGEPWPTSGGVAKLIHRPPRSELAVRQVGTKLTPRQMEIAHLATEAISTREIAARLMVKEGTVKVHLHNIYQKLGVDNRLALLVYARENAIA
jgi:DNA-binding NarL/FixJ family response regulator